MPSQKPSPHRFIAPVPPTQIPKSKPKSNLRHALSTHTSELKFKKITPAKRFVAAPAQAHANEGTSIIDTTPLAPDRVESPTSSLPSYEVTPRPKARKLEKVDSIEEANSSQSWAANEYDTYGVAHGSELFGGEEENSGENSEDEDELLFESNQRAKKRRTSPSLPTRHHKAAETPVNAASHRFRLPSAQAPLPFSLDAASHMPPTGTTTKAASATNGSNTTSTRPHFLLPVPRSPSRPSAPLPEIFSPSRKAQKYVPGGLASTVQSLIIEAAQLGSGTGIVWGREREDGVRVKFRISGLQGEDEAECHPGGTTFVVGEKEPGMYTAPRADSSAEGQGMKVLLAGHGGARGSAGVKVKVGSIIGIRAPTWELEVCGETWAVGVDWIVL